MQQFGQMPIVNFGHIGETLAPFLPVGSDQRIAAHQIYMIADNHEIPRTKRRIDAAGCIGEQHRRTAHAAEKFDRQHHRLPADAFVIMAAPAPRGDEPAAAPVEDEPPAVTAHRRGAESGNVAVGRAENDFIGLKRLAPPGAEHNSDIGRITETFIGEIGGGLVEETYIHHQSPFGRQLKRIP